MRKPALSLSSTFYSPLSRPMRPSSASSTNRPRPSTPPHRGARVELRAAHSAFTKTTTTAQDGSFTLPSIPLGDYLVTVSQPGFSTTRQAITLASDTAPILHFELQLASVQQSTTVTTSPDEANLNTVTPTALISREDIAQTPGADLHQLHGHDHRLRPRSLHDP